MSLFDHTIKELEEKLHTKEITAEDLVNESLDRIKEVDEQIQAFLTVDEENARAKAKELDKEADASAKLFGMPAGIKDNIMTKGVRTTAGSKFLENFEDPLYDATVIQKLNQEKSVMIGKLNMDEFAMGSSNENSAYQLTRNPWNTDYVPGGSSGGAAAAVAAGEVLFALGSDTGGSIRQPAAYCGVVGMKPTYGRVSRFGLAAFASSLDQIGPITRTVEDNARVLEIISGVDEMDSTSVHEVVPAFSEELKKDLQGLKIAVPEEYLSESVSEEVKQSVMEALKVYESLGATWEKVSMPHSKYALAAYYILSSGEASTEFARYDGIRYGVRAEDAKDLDELYTKSRGQGFGDEVKRRIILGTFALSGGQYEKYYEKALRVRTLIKNDFDKIFEQYDVIIGPTTPTPAFKFGEKTENPFTMYTNDILTIPVSLAGVPAISIPCGFSKEELPIGLQIIGKPFAESTVYQTAYAFEQATDYHTKRPRLGGNN